MTETIEARTTTATLTSSGTAPTFEPFSWLKFFKGLIDPTAYFKTLAIVLRMALVVLIVWVVWIAGNFIQAKLAPKKQLPAVFTVNAQQGGAVKNSADQKETKFGLINL